MIAIHQKRSSSSFRALGAGGRGGFRVRSLTWRGNQRERVGGQRPKRNKGARRGETNERENGWVGGWVCRSSPCSAVVTQSGSVVFRPPTSATLDSSRPSRAIPLPAGVSFHPSTPQTAAASGLGRWLLGSHVNLLEAGLLDEVADGLLQVVDPGTHLVDPADDGVGHLLEAGLLRIVKGRGTRAAQSVLFVCLFVCGEIDQVVSKTSEGGVHARTPVWWWHVIVVDLTTRQGRHRRLYLPSAAEGSAQSPSDRPCCLDLGCSTPAKGAAGSEARVSKERRGD